ncbi:MAG: hypothetical protein R3183_05225 [Oleiphilaceae bacterium]|nr:hypothetical protein [Oleiphilaceae bacterium]
MNTLSSFYPVISAAQPTALVRFLTEELDFVPVYTSDWYWHLSMPSKPDTNIAIVDCHHESIPEGFRQPVQGVLLNFELDDAKAFYDAVSNKNWRILLPLKDEEWGQRHFIAATPEPGLMLDIIELIPPSEAFQKNYHHEAEPA